VFLPFSASDKLTFYTLTADDALVASIAEVYNADRTTFTKNVRSVPSLCPTFRSALILFLSFRAGSGVGQEGTPHFFLVLLTRR
jgi:hypothetical protein